MRRIAFILLCAAVLALAGCKAKNAVEEAAISAGLQDKGTTELLKEAAEDTYEEPADGRLTEKQIEMYLKVREHEKKIAAVAKKEMEAHVKKAEEKGEKSLTGMMDAFKAAGSAADLFTADIRAAKELGYNTAEYQWVKGKVLEASGAQMTLKLQQASVAMFDSTYQQTKKQYDEATDEATKKMLGEMLASYEKSKAEVQGQDQQIDEATRYNLQLLSKHENALNALATELSKFESKPGETQQGIAEWEKNLDKAVKDAKAGAQ